MPCGFAVVPAPRVEEKEALVAITKKQLLKKERPRLSWMHVEGRVRRHRWSITPGVPSPPRRAASFRLPSLLLRRSRRAPTAPAALWGEAHTCRRQACRPACGLLLLPGRTEKEKDCLALSEVHRPSVRLNRSLTGGFRNVFWAATSSRCALLSAMRCTARTVPVHISRFAPCSTGAREHAMPFCLRLRCSTGRILPPPCRAGRNGGG